MRAIWSRDTGASIRVMRSAGPALATAGALIATAIVPAHAAADDVVHPWNAVGDSLGEIYGWPNVALQLSAVAVTPPLFQADEALQEELQSDDPGDDPFGAAANSAGYILPALPLGLYGVGAASGADEIATAGAAALQAVVVQGVTIRALKLLTDRAAPCTDGTSPPRFQNNVRCSVDSDDFDFNPLRVAGGRSWPSGHTSISFALVSSFVAFYPDEPWLAFLGYPLAAAIGAGMIEADYHWLSDVVAGALIGHSVGWAVGKTFRRRFDATRYDDQEERAGRSARARLSFGLSTKPLGVNMNGEF